MADSLVGDIGLEKSDGQWRLPSPIEFSYLGFDFTIYEVELVFESTSSLTGTIRIYTDVFGQNVFGQITLSFQKQPSQSISCGSSVDGLSGAEESYLVFEIDVSAGASDVDIETWGGSGDCDLFTIYHKPDFEIYFSDDIENEEEITISSPQSGKWYIILYGYDSYSGVSLNVTWDEAPTPLVGDWDGDGQDEPGLYYASERRFSLDNNADGVLDQHIEMGLEGDLPVIGDWDGNGSDDIGGFRASERRFYLCTDRDGGPEISVTIGRLGDVPCVGDWDRDGTDDIGVFRPSLRRYYMDFDEDGLHDRAVTIGQLGDLSLVGDWDGDGADSIGVYRPGNHRFYLDDNDDGWHDHACTLGITGDVSVTGDWDGDSSTDVGVYRPGDNTFYLDHNVDGVVDETVRMTSP